MSFLKAMGYISSAMGISYLTLTSMMQDPNKPYRGHLNIIVDDSLDENFKSFKSSCLNMKSSVKNRFLKLYGNGNSNANANCNITENIGKTEDRNED